GSAWDRTACEAPPRRTTTDWPTNPKSKSRRSLQDGAFPGRAWEREEQAEPARPFSPRQSLGPRGSRQHQRHPETEVAVTEARRVRLARRTAAVVDLVAPATAAHRKAALLVEVTDGVLHWPLRVRPRLRRAELPHVAEHVV